MQPMTFRELIQRHYLDQGVNLFDAFVEIRGTRAHPATGLGIATIRKAYNGTEVEPRTAAALVAWASEKHGVQLGFVELVSAPAAKRSPVDWERRAREAIEAELLAHGFPVDESMEVSFRGGIWQACKKLERHGPLADGLCAGGVTLGAALRALRLELGGAPANDNAAKRGEHAEQS